MKANISYPEYSFEFNVPCQDNWIGFSIMLIEALSEGSPYLENNPDKRQIQEGDIVMTDEGHAYRFDGESLIGSAIMDKLLF